MPHAGRDSRTFRDITILGRHLQALGEVRHSAVAGVQVAMLHDNEGGWALESGLKPTNRPSYADTARAVHDALFQRAVTADIVPPWAPLEDYGLVAVPGLYLVSDENARAVHDYVDGGGTVLVTWFSGIVDEVNTVRSGEFAGAFRDLLGVTSEEFSPLMADETVLLDNGWTARRWTELLHTTATAGSERSAEVVAGYTSGALAGHPAITRRTVGAGTAWYLSADLDEESLGELVEQLLSEADIEPTAITSRGVEAVRRASSKNSYLFLINHSDAEGWADASGTDLLTGTAYRERVFVEPGSVAVIREQ